MKIFIRLFIGILSLFFIMQGLWPIALLILSVGLFSFPFYLEIIIAGYIFDNLYSSSYLGFAYRHLGLFISLLIYVFYTILIRILRK